jgi:hypothetical protein
MLSHLLLSRKIKYIIFKMFTNLVIFLSILAKILNLRLQGRILYGNETDINEYPWQVRRFQNNSIV